MDPKLFAQITRLLTEMANTADEEATKTDDDAKKGVAVGLGLAVAVLLSVQDEVAEVAG